MTEQEIKFICKQLVEHGNKPLTNTEKELIKQAIDKSKNLNELLTVALNYEKYDSHGNDPCQPRDKK